MSEINEPYLADAVADDSCVTRYIEIVPLTRDSDHHGTTECDSPEDCPVEVDEEMLQEIKQEPDDVCSIVAVITRAHCVVHTVCVFVC